jgi:hypothetical protein
MFAHPIYRVVSFAKEAPYVLRVRFDDGHQQLIDFEPLLVGELLGALRDVELFNGVQIDPEIHTLVWPNGADFDPATLHDWDVQGPLLAARLRELHLNPL